VPGTFSDDERRALLFEAWARLDPVPRRLVWLDLVERRPAQDIGRQLGIHPAAVPTALVAAREVLRATFAELDGHGSRRTGSRTRGPKPVEHHSAQAAGARSGAATRARKGSTRS